MKRYYTFILIFFLSFNNIYAQTADRFEAAVQSALHKDQFFTNSDFFGVSAKDSLSIKDQFRFAEAAKGMNAIRIAEMAYLRVLRMDSLNKKIKYPEAAFQVGAMKQLQGKYVEALPYFEQYLSSPPPIDNQYLNLAKKAIDDCRFAIERVKKEDANYSIKHLGESINTPFNDFAPLLVGDQLYFSSLKYQKEEKMDPPRLYAKVLINDFETGTSLLEGFNKKEKSVTNLTFTKDQQRAYYTICDYVGKSRIIRCKIYYQDKQVDGTWGKAQVLPKHINRDGFTTTQPTIAYNQAGEELLYFSSNCPGGKGKMDIWFTKIEANNTFAQPTNLQEVNTTENDLTPFYHQATNKLYFSSNGRAGLGGYDIYAFSNGEVEHGGYPLNSSYNDTHFTLDPSGDKGYFSSSREGCLRLSEYDMGCQDIYEVEFINIDLEVLTFDDLSKKALAGTTVQLYQMPSATNRKPDANNIEILLDSRTNTLDNEFQFDGLLKDTPYRLIATKEGYSADTVDFHTRGITQSTTIKKELFLMPDVFEMDLLALTFDKESRKPLNRCIVQLIDLETEERLIKDNIGGNDFYFDIYSQRSYRLIASLIGYSTDTLDFNTFEYVNEANDVRITKRLYLEPGGIIALEDLLPLTFYFDNDRPDPRTRGITTTYNYEELYTAYYRKKGEFIAKYTEGLKGEEQAIKTQKIIDFFDKDLKGNFDTLGVFSETLIKYLQRGNSAVISIRGFASPLAASDYNINLGKRRVNCLMNHFASYRDGMLMEYINNGNLVLQEISFGDEKAPPFISENPKDRRNSVYSPEASKERKVQIVKITIGEKAEGE